MADPQPPLNVFHIPGLDEVKDALLKLCEHLDHLDGNTLRIQFSASLRDLDAKVQAAIRAERAAEIKWQEGTANLRTAQEEFQTMVRVLNTNTTSQHELDRLEARCQTLTDELRDARQDNQLLTGLLQQHEDRHNKLKSIIESDLPLRPNTRLA